MAGRSQEHKFRHHPEDYLPTALVVGNWDLADAEAVEGDALTVSVDEGVIRDASGALPLRLDVYVDDAFHQSIAITGGNITGLTEDVAVDIKLVLVNEAGSSADSDVKSGTPTPASDYTPDAIATEKWSVADAADPAGDTVTITLAADPLVHVPGHPTTSINVYVDGVFDRAIGIAAGDYDIDGLTEDVEVDITLKAVNNGGEGTVSDIKPVTPTDGV